MPWSAACGHDAAGWEQRHELNRDAALLSDFYVCFIMRVCFSSRESVQSGCSRRFLLKTGITTIYGETSFHSHSSIILHLFGWFLHNISAKYCPRTQSSSGISLPTHSFKIWFIHILGITSKFNPPKINTTISAIKCCNLKKYESIRSCEWGSHPFVDLPINIIPPGRPSWGTGTTMFLQLSPWLTVCCCVCSRSPFQIPVCPT